MTQTDALTQALVLAIIATSDQQMQKALALASSFAQGLSIDQVEQCKARAADIMGIEQ